MLDSCATELVRVLRNKKLSINSGIDVKISKDELRVSIHASRPPNAKRYRHATDGRPAIATLHGYSRVS